MYVCMYVEDAENQVKLKCRTKVANLNRRIKIYVIN